MIVGYKYKAPDQTNHFKITLMLLAITNRNCKTD